MNEKTEPMDAVAIQNEAGQIVVADPFFPGKYHADAQGIIDAMTARKRERLAQFNALGDLATAPIDAVAELCKATEADDKALQSMEKRLKDALLDICGFKTVSVQMKGAGFRIDPLSVRGALTRIIKECKARLDAEKPPKPKHTYIIKITASDDALMATIKAAEKSSAEGVCYATAQSDKAVKQIMDWFAANA